MKLTVINTGTFKLDGGAMFGVVPKKIWKHLNPPDENNLCTWSMRCLLVEWDNRKMLVDCGMGDKQDPKFFGHYEPTYQPTLIEDLASKGYTVNDITDVFLTHLHFDHCGGAITKNEKDQLVTTFPNATYWSNQAHWEWAVNPNAREKASFLKENFIPLVESGQLKMIPVEQGIEAFPGIAIFFAFGHTEAMMIPKINYKNQVVCYMADLLPSVDHIPLPYVMAYDTRPLLTMVEKAAFLKEAEEKKYVLFFEHDAKNECCTLLQTEKGIKAEKTFLLDSL
jgi:glyoxylase-like metal-dependent hydrolase (beta-lactamase superfamily II)